jgi:hypothetical protein
VWISSYRPPSVTSLNLICFLEVFRLSSWQIWHRKFFKNDWCRYQSEHHRVKPMLGKQFFLRVPKSFFLLFDIQSYYINEKHLSGQLFELMPLVVKTANLRGSLETLLLWHISWNFINSCLKVMTTPGLKSSGANFLKFCHGVSKNACEFPFFSIIWKMFHTKNNAKMNC